MDYTMKQISEITGLSEHTIRYYTDRELFPCERNSSGRRLFTEESLNWLRAIQYLKKCGMSLESIKEYCDLCQLPESHENLEKRYQIILEYQQKAYQKLEDAKELVEYMDCKTKNYQEILAGHKPDTANPRNWDQLAPFGCEEGEK